MRGIYFYRAVEHRSPEGGAGLGPMRKRDSGWDRGRTKTERRKIRASERKSGYAKIQSARALV